LHQILRVLPVPRDEVQRLEEALVLLLEERVEAGPCLDAPGGEPHGLALCSHVPWMHEEPPALKSPPGDADGGSSQARHPPETPWRPVPQCSGVKAPPPALAQRRASSPRSSPTWSGPPPSESASTPRSSS